MVDWRGDSGQALCAPLLIASLRLRSSAARGGAIPFQLRNLGEVEIIGGLVMRRSILTFVLAAMSVCLIPVHFPAAGVIAAAPNHEVAQITAGPELEIGNDTFAIIRWTTTNPGRTDLHYGIVHYGTDAKN